MQTLGVQIESVSDGQVELSMPITTFMGQQHGAVHAGATFAIGDSASGYAAMTRMEPGRDVMTVEMKINLIAPAMGSRLIATGRVAKAGRRLVVTQCEIESEAEDGARKAVAILQGTMIPVDAPGA